MSTPFGDKLEDIKASIAAYTAEDIADEYTSLFWEILEALLVVTALPLAKMIEHAEHADAMGQMLKPKGFIPTSKRNLDRQLAILRALRIVQQDLFKGDDDD